MNRSYFLLLVFIIFLPLNGCLKEEPSSKSHITITTHLKRLKSERERTVEKALDGIGEIGAPAVPYILKRWKKADAPYRYQLCKALYRIGPAAEPAVPLLLKTLDDLDEQMVSHAAEALAGIGPAAAPAVEKLTQLLRSSDTSTQANLLKALGAIGPAAAPSIPRVMEAVEREKTREFAITALSKMGPKAVEAIKPWLKSDDKNRVLAACEVLRQVGSKSGDAINLLSDVLKNPDPQLKIAAINAIGQSGDAGLQMVQPLIETLSTKNKSVHNALVSALSDQGERIRDQLIDAMQSNNPRIREGIVQVIGRSADLRDSSMDELIHAMRDWDVNVRWSAIKAISSADDKIIPRMIGLLSSRNVNLRFGAAKILENKGSAARSAIPQVRKLLKDKDSLVREQAIKTLKALGA